MRKVLKYLFLIINLIILYYLLIINNWHTYNMTYIKTLIYVITTSVFIYVYGIVANDDKEYKRNVFCYFLLFFVLLFALTFIIGRPELSFSKNYHLSAQLKPFHTIVNQIKYGSTSSVLRNIIGNIIALIPLSFLLMIYDKRNNNVLRQAIVIIPTIIFIELFQDYSGTGTFDIDDIILNYSGTLLFTFVITRFNLIEKVRELFYTDFKLNDKTKNILFYVSLVLIIIINVLVFVDL